MRICFSSKFMITFVDMRRFTYILTGCLLLLSIESKAQFYTIKIKENLYKIERTKPKNNKEDVRPQIKGRIDSVTTQDTSCVMVQKERIGDVPFFAYPLKQIKVTSSFGYRKDPFTGKKRLHNGLDLRARNEEVYAMLHGKVIKTGEDRRSGKYVILQHSNIQISYCHLSKILVPAGTSVNPGKVVAISGSTGRSSGPHLHLTLRVNGEILDPSILLGLLNKTFKEIDKQNCYKS